MPEIVRRGRPQAAIRCRRPYGRIHYSAGGRGEAMHTDVRSIRNCSVDLSAQFGRFRLRIRLRCFIGIDVLVLTQLTVKSHNVGELVRVDSPHDAFRFADAGVHSGLLACGSPGRSCRPEASAILRTSA